MACTDCNKPTSDCGCTQEVLHISQVCNPIDCGTPECSEAQDAGCTVYAGADIVCGNVIVVESGISVAQALANIVAFVCSTNEIAFPKKFVFTGTLADPDQTTIIIPKADLTACGLITPACGAETSENPDMVISGYIYNPGLPGWQEFCHFDKSHVMISNTGDVVIECSFVPSPLPEDYPIDYRIVIVG